MHADQSQHRSPKGLVAREDYNPIISRAASLFKYERGLQMGKIIQFPGGMGHRTGIDHKMSG